MATVQTSSAHLERIWRLQTITIVWMSIEAAISLAAAWLVRSPALLAFGGDSAIELVSASVVLWRFRSAAENAERIAARSAGLLLLTLGLFAALAAALSLIGYNEPRPSFLGIGILAVAAILMPWLAREKGRLSSATGSAALRADAAESALCGYLSIIALAGVCLNSVWHIPWADPVAALVMEPLIVREASEAMKGKACVCPVAIKE